MSGYDTGTRELLENLVGAVEIYRDERFGKNSGSVTMTRTQVEMFRKAGEARDMLNDTADEARVVDDEELRRLVGDETMETVDRMTESPFSVEVFGLDNEGANRVIDLLEGHGYGCDVWQAGEEEFERDGELEE